MKKSHDDRLKESLEIGDYCIISLMKYLLIFFIRFYQWTLGSLFVQRCRFYPTCSNYAIEAYKKYGAIKGSYLVIKRIGKCHPWHPGGPDPLS